MTVRFILLFWILFVASAFRVTASSPLHLGQVHKLQNASVSTQTPNNKDVSLRHYLQTYNHSKDINNQTTRKDVLANREDLDKRNTDISKENLQSQTKLDIYRSYVSDDKIRPKNITRKKSSLLKNSKDKRKHRPSLNETDYTLVDKSNLTANREVHTTEARKLTYNELGLTNLLYLNNSPRYNYLKNKSDNDVDDVSSLLQKQDLSKDSSVSILPDIEPPLVNAVDAKNVSKIYEDILNFSYDGDVIVSSLLQKQDLSKFSDSTQSDIKLPLISSLDSNIASRKFSDIKESEHETCSLDENEELSNLNGEGSDSKWHSDAESNLISYLGLSNVTRITRDMEKTSDDDLVIILSVEEKKNYTVDSSTAGYSDIQYPFVVELDPKNELDSKNSQKNYRDTQNTSANDFESYNKLNTSTKDLALLSDTHIQNTNEADYAPISSSQVIEELRQSSSGAIHTQLQYDPAITNLSTVSRLDRNADSPSDYEYIPGLGYYKLHEQAQMWNDARKICQAEEAHLVVIGSLEEAQAISHLQEDTVVFVGIHDMFVTRQYVTLFDVPLETCGYVAWGPGQPNDDAEHCLAFDSDLTYHDYGCEDQLYFVCKKPVVVKKEQSTPEEDDDDLADGMPRGIVIGDYTLFRGIGLYKLHVDAKDWRSAWATCLAEGGHLAVITSQKQADAIKTLFYFKVTSFTDAFVGAHNLFGHKEFTTIFDSPVNMTSHNTASPMAFSGCLTIHRDGRYYNAAWPCSSSMPFVCQIPMK